MVDASRGNPADEPQPRSASTESDRSTPEDGSVEPVDLVAKQRRMIRDLMDADTGAAPFLSDLPPRQRHEATGPAPSSLPGGSDDRLRDLGARLDALETAAAAAQHMQDRLRKRLVTLTWALLILIVAFVALAAAVALR